MNRLYTSYSYKVKAFAYKVITAPANLPVSLAEVKSYLRVTGTTDDALITLLIQAATAFAEQYTRLTFIDTTFETFRDTFNDSLTVKRAPVSVINSIEYKKDEVLTLVPSTVYSFTCDNYYPFIYLREDQNWPTDIDPTPQAIRIEFVAGYGPDDTTVPTDIKLALMQHVNLMYSDRGDCACDPAASLPPESRAIYDMRKIIDISTERSPIAGCYYG